MKQHQTKPADPVLLAPILRTGIGYWVLVAILSAIVAFGLYAWAQQLTLQFVGEESQNEFFPPHSVEFL